MAREKQGYRSTAHTRRGAITTFGSRTDVGCVRDHNEDSLVVAPPLFVVADGMCGHAAGEVASEIATSILAEKAPQTPDAEALGHAVEEANLEIIAAAEDGRGREGMGTTCTAAILKEDRLIIAQVGDSRAYLLHQGKLQQLTRDHSLVAMMVEAGQLTPEEARVHPRRSVITRALGTDPSTKPDLYEIDVEAGDRLLLCSDGLYGMVEDPAIQAIMTRTADPQRCASQLVNEAIAAGGNDNVTVVVVDIEGKREAHRKKIALKTKLTIAFVLVLLAAIVAGAAWGVNAYVHNSAYLAEEDGNVAIYQGLPEPFLLVSYSDRRSRRQALPRRRRPHPRGPARRQRGRRPRADRGVPRPALARRRQNNRREGFHRVFRRAERGFRLEQRRLRSRFRLVRRIRRRSLLPQHVAFQRRLQRAERGGRGAKR